MPTQAALKAAAMFREGRLTYQEYAEVVRESTKEATLDRGVNIVPGGDKTVEIPAFSNSGLKFNNLPEGFADKIEFLGDSTIYTATTTASTKPMPTVKRVRTPKHGDTDRIPNCYGWWIHVRTGDDGEPSEELDLLYVVSPTEYTARGAAKTNLIESLPQGDDHIYVFLW